MQQPRPPLEVMRPAEHEPLLDFMMECRSYTDRTLLERFRAGPEALPSTEYFYFIGQEALTRGLAPDKILTQDDRRRLRLGLDLDTLEQLLQRLRDYDQWGLLTHCSVDPGTSLMDWMDYLPASSIREQAPAFHLQADGLRFDDLELQALWDVVHSPSRGAA